MVWWWLTALLQNQCSKLGESTDQGRCASSFAAPGKESRVTIVGIDSNRAPSIPNASTLSITPRRSSSRDVLVLVYLDTATNSISRRKWCLFLNS
ncbi:hypothetical protein TNCV_2274911 [Trichonephila clavipes]|nr:hypothetical protein TNCV_2274911 [Trichonephila clavipes]